MNGVNDVAVAFNRPSSVKSASSLKANGSTLKHLVMFIGWFFSSSSSFFKLFLPYIGMITVRGIDNFMGQYINTELS